jgi:hypothetical protein
VDGWPSLCVCQEQFFPILFFLSSEENN